MYLGNFYQLHQHPGRIYLLILLLLTGALSSMAQNNLKWSELPALPDRKGLAGMFAGVSGDALFCFGGANFPEKSPKEGGEKKWYRHIYRLEQGKTWVKLAEALPQPLGYGVSINYQNKMILIGGSNQQGCQKEVLCYSWDGHKLLEKAYPALPAPLDNMAGGLTGHLLMIVGGDSTLTGAVQNASYGLDLEDLERGWFKMPPLPGAARALPQYTVYEGKLYVFGGEHTAKSSTGIAFRHILQDSYVFTPIYQHTGHKTGGTWTGQWTALAPMPKGLSAGPAPVPVLKNNKFLFWGGVDGLTALSTNSGDKNVLSRSMLLYDPATDLWDYLGEEQRYQPRVTLPAVHWNDQWHFINGEIRAGVRIDSVLSIQSN